MTYGCYRHVGSQSYAVHVVAIASIDTSTTDWGGQPCMLREINIAGTCDVVCLTSRMDGAFSHKWEIPQLTWKKPCQYILTFFHVLQEEVMEQCFLALGW